MNGRHFSQRFSLSFALLMLGNGVQLPFLPLWLQAQGLSNTAIATVIAAMTVVRVIGAPFFAAIADWTGNRFIVIRGCAFLTVLAYLGLSQTHAFTAILAMGTITAFIYAPVTPLIEGYSVEAASRLGLLYGRIRLWASLSFLAGSFISGWLLTVLPASATMFLITGAMAVMFTSTLLLPPEPPHPPHLPQVSAVNWRGALRFIFASPFTVVLLAASLASCSHGGLYVIGPVYWKSLGFNSFDIGVFWSAAITVEVVMFYFSAMVLKRISLNWMLLVGCAVCTLRWFGMGLATSYVPILALMALHGFTIVMPHFAMLTCINTYAPANVRNSAQAAYAALSSGLLLSSAQWAAGSLYDSLGGKMYWAMAAVSGLALIIAVYNLVKFSPKAPVAEAA